MQLARELGLRDQLPGVGQGIYDSVQQGFKDVNSNGITNELDRQIRSLAGIPGNESGLFSNAAQALNDYLQPSDEFVDNNPLLGALGQRSASLIPNAIKGIPGLFSETIPTQMGYINTAMNDLFGIGDVFNAPQQQLLPQQQQLLPQQQQLLPQQQQLLPQQQQLLPQQQQLPQTGYGDQIYSMMADNGGTAQITGKPGFMDRIADAAHQDGTPRAGGGTLSFLPSPPSTSSTNNIANDGSQYDQMMSNLYREIMSPISGNQSVSEYADAGRRKRVAQQLLSRITGHQASARENSNTNRQSALNRDQLQRQSAIDQNQFNRQLQFDRDKHEDKSTLDLYKSMFLSDDKQSQPTTKFHTIDTMSGQQILPITVNPDGSFKASGIIDPMNLKQSQYQKPKHRPVDTGLVDPKTRRPIYQDENGRKYLMTN